MTRKSRDERFMDLCRTAVTWGTCPRARVGAVVARGGQIISLGYNGSPPGQPHCDEVGCLIVNDHCKRARHAEPNALDLAGLERTRGATLYVSHFPCYDCVNDIIFHGIARVVYQTAYRIDERALKLLYGAVELDQFKDGRCEPVRILEVVE